MGYTAQSAGMVLSAGALAVLVALPIVGKLTTRFQARYLLAFGWISLAAGMYISSKQVDLLMSFRSATLLRVWQYLPVAFLFVPLTLAGYVGLPAEKTNAAAGLLSVASATMFLSSFLLKRNEPGRGGNVSVH
jgi:MFS transporter, DHA2 family, multidrug resistance protein